jgi:hypothetical protein
MYVWGQGINVKSLGLPFLFAMSIKLLFKNK